jgi:hypothetical protein
MDQDKIYRMVDYAYDRLNESDELNDSSLVKIGLCIGEARKSLYDILNELDSEKVDN